MSEKEIIEWFRKPVIEIGNLIIQYNGKKSDTVRGKYETWTIIRELPFYEEKDGNDKNE